LSDTKDSGADTVAEKSSNQRSENRELETKNWLYQNWFSLAEQDLKIQERIKTAAEFTGEEKRQWQR
jgi:hypothetical protein